MHTFNACGSHFRSMAVLSVILVSGCSTLPAPPRNALDLCAVLAEKQAWVKPATSSSEHWGVSVPVMMATMFHESSYRADARPPRRIYLGFIPGPRPSTALGYAQALEGTWNDYVSRNNRWFASRTDFADAIDFIGWYYSLSMKELGIRPDDTENLYLSYHEGRTGFANSSYLNKPWLVTYAQRVKITADSYSEQYALCSPAL